jgi:mycofactocin biosynthetic radical S-adenosylmethionine protein MftC
MARFRIRRERDGAIAYDRTNRKSAFILRDRMGPWPGEDMEAVVADALDESAIHSRDLEFLDNGLSELSALSAPVATYIEIADKCNLSCPHCYKGRAANGPRTLSTKEIKGVIDQLSAMGLLEFRITGLEPVIAPDFEAIANYAKSMGFYLVVNTNGTYGELYRKRIHRVGFDEVIVSIDGIEATHNAIRGKGSYQKAVGLLEELAVSDVKTRVNMAVSRLNLDEMFAVGDLAASLGSYVNYLPLRTGGTDSQLKRESRLGPRDMLQIVRNVNHLRGKYPDSRFLTYFDILSDRADFYHAPWLAHPCPARKNLYVSSAGATFPCDFLSYIGEKFCGGNVRDKSLQDIWHGHGGLEKYWNVQREDKCLNCCHLLVDCSGGCSSETLFKSDVYSDPLCFIDLIESPAICDSK